MKTDKYPRRVDAYVTMPDGRDLGLALIAAGLARPYSGGHRAGWGGCDFAGGGIPPAMIEAGVACLRESGRLAFEADGPDRELQAELLRHYLGAAGPK